MAVRCARWTVGLLSLLVATAVATACGIDIEGSAEPDASPGPGGLDSGVTSDGVSLDGALPSVDGRVDIVGPPCSLPDDAGAGVLCGGACVDATRDPLNCGGCGVLCGATQTCEGSCVDVGSALSGLRVNVPCTDDPNSEYCDTGTGTKAVTALVGGTAGKTYRVTIRVRGVIEQKRYNGAMGAGATGPLNPGFFMSGGSPDSTNWNNYSLEITDPPVAYRLNGGDSNHDYCDPLDYTAKVTAKAGAMIRLYAISPDVRSVRNRRPDGSAITVMGVAPYPQAYDGQFVVIDVLGVAPQ